MADAPDVAGLMKVFRKTLQDVEQSLQQNAWVVGDSFSLADVVLAPYFQTLHQFGWTALYEEGYPRVAEWCALS